MALPFNLDEIDATNYGESRPLFTRARRLLKRRMKVDFDNLLKRVFTDHNKLAVHNSLEM